MPIAKVQLPDGRIGRFEVAEGTTPEEVETFAAEQFSKIAKPEESIKPEQDKGFLGSVAEDISGRAKKVSEFAQRSDSPVLESPGIAAVGIGQVAGGLGDILGEGTARLIGAVVPEKVKEGIKNQLIDFSQTKIGKVGLAALEKGSEAFASFEENNPDEALILGSMLNVLGASVGTKGAKLTAKELKDISGDALTAISRRLPPDANKITRSITSDAIVKAIRPSVTNAKTATQSKAYFDKANDAVKTIIDNKPNLKLTDIDGNLKEGLPETLGQFAQSIDTTKKDIFKEYSKIAKESGEAGAELDLSNVAFELDSIITNKGMTDEIKQYAKKVQDELINAEKFTPEEAQTRIQVLNNKLSSVQDFNSASKASVDSLVVNILRKDLNDVVEGATGQQYKELKRQYGALKTIERDVNRRAMVDARKNVKGLIDFTDVFTGSEVVNGILSMNPAKIGAGLTGKVISTFTKSLNDPNKQIKKMFSSVDSIIERSDAAKNKFKPKSKILKKIVE